ncbi:thiol reductant ABC exporter subunit CydC [Vreelandella janggokensis]|nr:thiol reductant ABC exporter subunit CydC [Halomonas janggokensis]
MRDIYRQFLPWLRLLTRRRRAFMLGALLAGLTLLAGVALLGLSGWFITASALTGIALALGIPAILDVYVPGGGIRFFALLRTVSRYAERVYNHNSVLALLADLRFRVFGQLTRLDDSTLGRQRASDWLTRLTSDIDTLDNFYLRALMPPIVALLGSAIMVLFIALWLPYAALLVAGVLGGLWLVTTVGFSVWGWRQSHYHVGDQEVLRHLVIDQVQASAELTSYRSDRWHRGFVDTHEQQVLNNQRQVGNKQALGNSIVAAVTSLLALGVLWLAGEVLAQGQVDGPIVVMAVLMALGINEAFSVLPNAFVRLGASYAAVERLNKLEPRDSSRSFSPSTAVSLDDGVVFESVSLRYPSSLSLALSDVDFRLPAGKRAVVTGMSGAGKSTLASLILGRLVPTRGVVNVLGVAPQTLADTQRAAHLAMLTQQVDLFDASLAENLLIADPSASDERLWQVLSDVALADWAERLPRALDTAVGEKGQQLSGGQARRVALARLMLRDPQIVLLDEPFASVDAVTAQHLAASLDRWLGNRTVIYFIHQVDQPDLLPHIDYHWHLDAGKLGLEAN